MKQNYRDRGERDPATDIPELDEDRVLPVAECRRLLALLDRRANTVEDNADNVDFGRLQATAAENPRGITILGPPPFATAATR